MAKYIDREAAQAGLNASAAVLLDDPSEDEDYYRGCAYRAAAAWLGEVPAVEIVRCRDCAYLDYKDFRGYCTMAYLGTFVNPDDFCSHGKSKEDKP